MKKINPENAKKVTQRVTKTVTSTANTVTQKILKKRSERASSEILEEAVETYNSDDVTLEEVFYSLHERGFGLLLMILVLPNCVPIPVPPGVSTILAIPLLFLSLQMIWGYEYPWLPKWLKRKKLRRTFLANMIGKAAPKLKKIEKILRPRLSIASSETGEKIIGLFTLIFAISIAVPLPLTNFLPGVGILIMALGLLGRDGIVILIGAFIGAMGCLFTIAILLLGFQAVSSMLGI